MGWSLRRGGSGSAGTAARWGNIGMGGGVGGACSKRGQFVLGFFEFHSQQQTAAAAIET